MDRTQWAIAPYTEADLQKQIDQRRQVYGALGDAARRRRSTPSSPASTPTSPRRSSTRPSCRPSTPRSASRPRTWKAHRRDRRGVADRRHLRQGRRQRAELGASCSQALREALRHEARAAQAWADFRSKNDPEAPTTIAQEALPVRDRARRSRSAGSRCPTPARSTPIDRRPPPAARPRAATADGSIGAQLLRALRHAAARLELGAGRGARVGQRPPDRRAGPAGRLLRARRS